MSAGEISPAFLAASHRLADAIGGTSRLQGQLAKLRVSSSPYARPEGFGAVETRLLLELIETRQERERALESWRDEFRLELARLEAVDA
jgi:hypothetical protein